MADVSGDWRSVLSAMSDAYASGRTSHGEELLTAALDLGAPWDVVTSTAAQAMTRRRRSDRPVPAPAAS